MTKFIYGMVVVALVVYTVYFVYHRSQDQRVTRFVQQKNIAAKVGRELAEYLSETAGCLCSQSATEASVPFLRTGCSEAAPILLSVGQLFRGLKVGRIDSSTGKVRVHWDSGGVPLQPTEIKVNCGK